MGSDSKSDSDSSSGSSDSSSSESEEVAYTDGLFAVAGHDDRFGAAATYIGFIGVSILLFFCSWFVRGSLKEFGKGGYSSVQSSYESETDADVNGNPYGANKFDDDWDDNYDLDYASNQSKDATKGKFWAQYSSI